MSGHFPTDFSYHVVKHNELRLINDNPLCSFVSEHSVTTACKAQHLSKIKVGMVINFRVSVVVEFLPCLEEILGTPSVIYHQHENEDCLLYFSTDDEAVEIA